MGRPHRSVPPLDHVGVVRANRLIFLVSISVLCVFCIWIVWPPVWLRVEYHRYYLSRDEHTLRRTSSNYTVTPVGAALPKLGKTDYLNVQKSLDSHVGALVQLGYLQRIEFPMTPLVLTGSVKRLLYSRITQTMPTNYFWMCDASSNGASIIVTCPTTETQNWSKLITDFQNDKP